MGGCPIKANLIQLNVGEPKEYVWKDQVENSAIGKSKVTEAYLSKAGFASDGVANTKAHGGPDRAVCLYPYEHYIFWEKEFGKRLSLPAFGENITTIGMTERAMYIGDVVQFGDAVIEVTQGRVPCSTISKHNGINPLLNRIVETCLTGYFFRVIKEGTIHANAELKLLDRVQENYSILRGNQILFHEQENIAAIEEMLQLKALSDEWRNRFNKILAR